MRETERRVVAMGLMAARQASGLLETFRCPTVRDPAERRRTGKECGDGLPRWKELQRGMHDVRRAIPGCGSVRLLMDGVRSRSSRFSRFFVEMRLQFGANPETALAHLSATARQP